MTGIERIVKERKRQIEEDVETKDKKERLSPVHKEWRKLEMINDNAVNRAEYLEKILDHIGKCVMCQNQGTEKCSNFDYLRRSWKEVK
jgi:hypothetical protein